MAQPGPSASSSTNTGPEWVSRLHTLTLLQRSACTGPRNGHLVRVRARLLMAPGCSGVLTNWQGGSSGVPLRTPPQQHHSSSSTSQRAARPPADPDVAKLQLPSGGCCGNREDVMSARCVAALRPLTRPSLVGANEATGQQRGDSQSAWSV